MVWLVLFKCCWLLLEAAVRPDAGCCWKSAATTRIFRGQPDLAFAGGCYQKKMLNGATKALCDQRIQLLDDRFAVGTGGGDVRTSRIGVGCQLDQQLAFARIGGCSAACNTSKSKAFDLIMWSALG